MERFLIVVFFYTALSFAHCQIPCGIYDDQMRRDVFLEHLGTLKKSIFEIKKIEATRPIAYNQLVRWIGNKELHVDKVDKLIKDYFLKQRIKPLEEGDKGYEVYLKELALLHRILYHAMKVRQTVDEAHVDAMENDFNTFYELYTHQ